jgi:hypothetical protein
MQSLVGYPSQFNLRDIGREHSAKRRRERKRCHATDDGEKMFWAADDDVDSEVVCNAKKKAGRRCYDTHDCEEDVQCS